MNEPTTVGPDDDRQESRDEPAGRGGEPRTHLDQQERTIAALSREVDLHSKAIGWRLQQRLIPLRRSRCWPFRSCVRSTGRCTGCSRSGWTKGSCRSSAGQATRRAWRFAGRNFLVEGARSADLRESRTSTSSGCASTACPRTGGDDAGRDRTLSRATADQRARMRWTPSNPMRLGGLLATLRAQSIRALGVVCLAVQRRSCLAAQLSDHDSRRSRIEPRVRLAQGSSAYADALRVASGEFIGVMNAGDDLAPEALFELVKRLNESGCRHRVFGRGLALETGRREDPLFKPDWGPDLLLSTNYLERFGIFRRQLVERGRRLSSPRWARAGLRPRASTDRAHRSDRTRSEGALSQPTPADDGGCRAGASCGQSRRGACARRGARTGVARRDARSAVFARKGPRCYATRFDLTAAPAGLDHHPHAGQADAPADDAREHLARAPTTTATRSSSSTTRARMPTP